MTHAWEPAKVEIDFRDNKYDILRFKCKKCHTRYNLYRYEITGIIPHFLLIYNCNKASYLKYLYLSCSEMQFRNVLK